MSNLVKVEQFLINVEGSKDSSWNWEDIKNKIESIEWSQEIIEGATLDGWYVVHGPGRYEYLTITLKTGAWMSFSKDRYTQVVTILDYGKNINCNNF